MPLRQRITGSIALLALGGLAWVFLGGTPVTRCLGPLGRTIVDSVRDGCVSPTVGIGFSIAAATLVAATLNLASGPGDRLPAKLAGAAAGVVVGLLGYLAIRHGSITGPTLTGAVETVPLPFDWPALAAACVLGAGAGWLLADALSRLRLARLA
jgi:hypothetical protein